jgi:hypothetical protein
MADYNVATPKFITTEGTYSMPYAPDLKVTLINEMDGVDRVRTKGGSDLVDHKYIRSRAGRRGWLISYSYFGDSDLDNFHTKVIKATGGGQLPFTFRPDNSQSGYNITCKFDMNSFQYKQVANGLYSVKLKIREVW